MRILILTQFFTPEIGATSARLHTFAANLAARGHDIEVIAEMPNHPQGVVHDDFRGLLLRRGRIDGFRTTWVWVRTRPEKGSRDRLAFYSSYAASAATWSAMTLRPDVIFASSPPLPVGVAAAAGARFRRSPWVLDVRDLWPDVAVSLGELSNQTLLKLARRLERFLYRDAAAVTTVTEPFRRHIASTLDRPDKVALVPNGTTSIWLEAGARHVERRDLGLPVDRFVWTFAGNLGLAQGLDTAIRAAELLGDDFQLLLLGDGAAKPSLEAHASRVTPGRVAFHPQVAPRRAADFLRASNALLVSLARDPTLAAFVPSKLFDCCATGTPVIVAAPGEASRLAEATGAALTVPPGDSGALSNAVRLLRDAPELASATGRRGRAFGAANLRERHVERLEALLEQAARYPRRRRSPMKLNTSG